jgi:GLPGLI family protein
MEQETKMIGENLCFKATTIIEMPANANSFSFGRRNNDNKEEVKEEEEKIELVPVIAWYSMDIPVSHGPGDYWGLPGLILEINAGNTHILCTKIVLNPKEKADLSEPSKGKVVTQKEYDEILKVKMKEMRERFSNERQKSGDGGMHIRVGG